MYCKQKKCPSRVSVISWAWYLGSGNGSICSSWTARNKLNSSAKEKHEFSSTLNLLSLMSRSYKVYCQTVPVGLQARAWVLTYKYHKNVVLFSGNCCFGFFSPPYQAPLCDFSSCFHHGQGSHQVSAASSQYHWLALWLFLCPGTKFQIASACLFFTMKQHRGGCKGQRICFQTSPSIRLCSLKKWK